MGEYRTSNDPGIKLIAIVGSCVAVALYDTAVKTAGLLHVVLPGGDKTDKSSRRNTFYADTGIPVLLTEMIGMGARKENMKAYIAGGASMLTDGIMGDVGRRNLEAVRAILEAEGLHYEHAGIGGKNGRRIEMDVETGRLTVFETLRPSIPETVDTGDKIDRRLVTEAVNNLTSLRPNPHLSGKLLEAIHQQSINWDEVRRITSRDLILSLHVFRLMNSSYYGQPGRIPSFQASLEKLGPKQVRRILVAAANMRQADSHISDSGTQYILLSRRYLAAAVISRRLAGRTAAQLSNEAFTAGLCRGAGPLVLLARAHQTAPTGARDIDVWKSHDNQLGPLKAVGPRKLGGAILSELGFPEAIVKAVAGRTDSIGESGGSDDLAVIADVACGISLLLTQAPLTEAAAGYLSLDNLNKVGLNTGLAGLDPELFIELKNWGLLESLNFDSMNLLENGNINQFSYGV